METEKSCLLVDNENTLSNEKLSNDTEYLLPDYYIFGITEEFTMYKPRDFSAEQQRKRKAVITATSVAKLRFCELYLLKEPLRFPNNSLFFGC